MDNDVVRAEFWATIDDFVDLNTRLSKISPASRQFRIRDCILSGIVGGAACYVVLSSGSSWSILLKLSVAAIVAIAMGALSVPLNRLITNSRVRKLVAERFNNRNDIKCIFEIRENGFWIMQDNVEVRHDWPDIKDATIADEDIVIHLKSGISIIRHRAFATKLLKNDFVDAIHKHIQRKT